MINKHSYIVATPPIMRCDMDALKYCTGQE